MTTSATPISLSEARARLFELARRVRQQHERITVTRNGEPEAVLLSVDDFEGLETTLEILGDTDAVAGTSLLDHVGLFQDLEELLGVGVDVVARSALKLRDEHIRTEAVDL